MATDTLDTEEVTNYFGGVDGDQDAGFDLLPTRERDGAPDGNRYLFQMDEEEIQVKHSGDESKNPGTPYVNFRAVVLAPEEFEDRSQFGMLYPPMLSKLDDNAGEKEIIKANKKFENAKSRFVGQVDGLLGDGTAAALTGTLEDMMEELCEQVKGVVFVGTLSLRKQTGRRDSTQITRYDPEISWGEDNDEND